MNENDHRKAVRIRLHDEDNVRINFTLEGDPVEGAVWDYSRYGLGIRIPSDKTLVIANGQPNAFASISDIIITAYGDKRNLGNGKISRIDHEEEGAFFGVYLTSEFIDLDFLADKQKLLIQEDDLRKLKLFFQQKINIKEDFKRFAADFSYGLSTFKRILDIQDEKFNQEPGPLKESLFLALMEGLGGELLEYMDQSTEELNLLVADYSKTEHEQNGYYLRKVIWRFIMEAPFMSRTNLKPRGYAGDSKMMEIIYSNQYEGDSSFGKILHKHAVRMPAAQAVRNRRVELTRKLDNRIQDLKDSGKEKPFRICSIACGPAWEIRDFFTSSSHKHDIDMYLLDQDQEALDEAKGAIEAIPVSSPLSVNYVIDSVRTILKSKAPALNYGHFDFIYSLGLFDYLTVPVAQAVLGKLFEMTESGGQIIIGNFHIRNPTRVYMDYIMDWSLLYRSDNGLLKLTHKLPGRFNATLETDETGIQMFLIIDKE